MTAELLGNWTYGYIGESIGFPAGALFAGSWYADGFSQPFHIPANRSIIPAPNPAFWQNEFTDWQAIASGFRASRYRHYARGFSQFPSLFPPRM